MTERRPDFDDALAGLQHVSKLGDSHPLGYLSRTNLIQVVLGPDGSNFAHVSGYLRTFQEFSISILQGAVQSTRFQKHDPHELAWKLKEEDVLGASIQLNSSNKSTVTITRGTFLALYDICLRAVSAQDFFNVSPEMRTDDMEHWKGSVTLECYPYNLIQPRHRYFDYRLMARNSGSAKVDDSGEQPFIRRFPLDLSRISIADSMFFDAVRWIVLHEESHYRLGHLHYLTSLQSGNMESSLSLSEFRLHASSTDAVHTTPILEWEADRGAAQLLADQCLWIGSDDYMSEVPGYIRKDEMWQVRYLLTTMGLAAIALDEGRLHAGEPANYPTVRARLCTMMQSTLLRILSGQTANLISLNDRSGRLDLERLVIFVQRVSESFMDIEAVISLIRSDDGREEFDINPLIKDPGYAYLMGIIYTYSGLIRAVVGEQQKEKIEKIMNIHLNSIEFDLENVESSIWLADMQETLDEYFSLYELDGQKYWKVLESFRNYCTP